MDVRICFLLVMVFIKSSSANERIVKKTVDSRTNSVESLASLVSESVMEAGKGMKTSNKDRLIGSKAQHILSMHTKSGGCPFAQSGGCPFANKDSSRPKRSYTGTSQTDCKLPIMDTKDLKLTRKIVCGQNDNKYRRLNGICNNLKHPLQGSAGHKLNRIIKPRYEDGDNPVGWNESMKYNGFKLPLSRDVTVNVVATNVSDADPLHHWLISSWGQFSAYGISHTPHVMDCKCSCKKKKGCYPITIPFGTNVTTVKCIPFGRSRGIHGLKPREQFSDVSAYIDGSQVYGSSEDQLKHLRKGDTAMMKINAKTTKDQYSLLPNSNDSCTDTGEHITVPCMLTGDVRANILPNLLTLHTLFVREHNRIALLLKSINSDVSDETVFQETRKIIGATIQHIHYKHYLPLVLRDTVVIPDRGSSTYMPSVDASLTNEFSTAAYRFAHGTIFHLVYMLNKTMQGEKGDAGGTPLSKIMFATHFLYNGIDSFLRGMFSRSSKKPDANSMCTTEITNGRNFVNGKGFDDLSSRNIQRGRDHGLPQYAAYLRQYEIIEGTLHTFDDLEDIIKNPDVRNKLKAQYHHPENIDLWVGGMAELSHRSSDAGHLFSIMLKDQFTRLFEGDRFFYTHDNVFEKDQLESLRKYTLAGIICSNSQINEVPADVFNTHSKMIPCNKIPKLDLNLWGQLKE